MCSRQPKVYTGRMKQFCGFRQLWDYLLRGDDMSDGRQLTAVIEREGDGYVATFPELDKVKIPSAPRAGLVRGKMIRR